MKKYTEVNTSATFDNRIRNNHDLDAIHIDDDTIVSKADLYAEAIGSEIAEILLSIAQIKQLKNIYVRDVVMSIKEIEDYKVQVLGKGDIVICVDGEISFWRKENRKLEKFGVYNDIKVQDMTNTVSETTDNYVVDLSIFQTDQSVVQTSITIPKQKQVSGIQDLENIGYVDDDIVDMTIDEAIRYIFDKMQVGILMDWVNDMNIPAEKMPHNYPILEEKINQLIPPASRDSAYKFKIEKYRNTTSSVAEGVLKIISRVRGYEYNIVTNEEYVLIERSTYGKDIENITHVYNDDDERFVDYSFVQRIYEIFRNVNEGRVIGIFYGDTNNPKYLRYNSYNLFKTFNEEFLGGTQAYPMSFEITKYHGPISKQPPYVSTITLGKLEVHIWDSTRKYKREFYIRPKYSDQPPVTISDFMEEVYTCQYETLFVGNGTSNLTLTQDVTLFRNLIIETEDTVFNIPVVEGNVSRGYISGGSKTDNTQIIKTCNIKIVAGIQLIWDNPSPTFIIKSVKGERW